MDNYASEPAKRKVYMDVLRIAATFAVMLLHTASQYWYAVDVGSYEWKVFSFYDGTVRWAVPVFVMISGALFLSRDISIEKIYKKYILRIVTAYIFWSALYALINLITGRSRVKNALREFVEGPSHLWFLFMIAGLYILTPILKKIVANDLITKYFVAISMVFTFLLPFIINILSFYSEKASSVAESVVGSVCFTFTLNYVSYFVLGYYLSRMDMNGKARLGVFLCGGAGVMVTLFSNYIFPIAEQRAVSIFHENMSINVMLVSVMIFMLFKFVRKFEELTPKTVGKLKMLSEYSFGAYLVHAMVITGLNHICGLNSLSFDPLFSVPIISVIAFALSYMVSAVIHRIPVLNKYIV